MNRILFIDDESEIIESYQEIFSNEKKNTGLDWLKEKAASTEISFTTHSVLQGMDGVELVKEYARTDDPIKVAFIDMRMPPGIDGLQTAKMIHDVDSRVEIIFVTAYSDNSIEDISDKIKDVSKILYLKKPFDSQEVRLMAINLTTKYDSIQAQEKFVAGVTHELLTPLSAIIGCNQLLYDEVQDQEQKELTQIIKDSSSLMKFLVEELLLTFEIDRAGLVLKKDPVNLNDFLTKVYSSLKPLFYERPIKFSCEVEGINPETTFSFDEKRVWQCINSLVYNSSKFTEQGEVKLRLIYENGLVIEVDDTGEGIPRSERENVFKRFSRLEDKHHNKPGLGLGLNIVKEIIELHNAHVEIDSQKEQGTKFRLVFTEEA